MSEGEAIVALTKARSMLVILWATCDQTLLALDAAGNTLDVDMTEDLRKMIARTREEVAVIDERLAALRG